MAEEQKPSEMTLDDAKAMIKDLEKKLAQVPTPEAVYSFSTVALSKDGLSATWTIRARHGEDGKSFYHRVDHFVQYAIGNGWNVPSKIVAQQTQLPTQPQANTPPTKSVDAPKAGDEVETFKAQSMSATVNAGKTYWKVIGGKYSKYGLTIWKEALEEAGFAFDKLDPMTTYDLSAFTAHVWKDETGKATKVFKLTK